MNKLSLCRLCGHEAITTISTNGSFQVYCSNDNCILNDLVMCDKHTEQEAIDEWNKICKYPNYKAFYTNEED